MFDRSDMRRLDLRSTATIDQPQSCDGATFAISPENAFPKISITHNAIGQLIGTLSHRHMFEYGLWFREPALLIL